MERIRLIGPRLVKQSYILFPSASTSFAKMGKVVLSDDIQDLLVEAKPQIEVTRNGSLLDISFDLSEVDPIEINQAIQALLNRPKTIILVPVERS